MSVPSTSAPAPPPSSACVDLLVSPLRLPLPDPKRNDISIMSNTVLEQDSLDPAVKIECAASLGAPYDLHKSSELLKPFPNRVYSQRMAQGLVQILRTVAHNFDGVTTNYLGEEGKFRFDPDACYASKSILDFDEALTAPFFGFSSARDYYDYSSPGR